MAERSKLQFGSSGSILARLLGDPSSDLGLCAGAADWLQVLSPSARAGLRCAQQSAQPRPLDIRSEAASTRNHSSHLSLGALATSDFLGQHDVAFDERLADTLELLAPARQLRKGRPDPAKEEQALQDVMLTIGMRRDKLASAGGRCRHVLEKGANRPRRGRSGRV